jgi:hypothetical protein
VSGGVCRRASELAPRHRGGLLLPDPVPDEERDQDAEGGEDDEDAVPME